MERRTGATSPNAPKRLLTADWQELPRDRRILRSELGEPSLPLVLHAAPLDRRSMQRHNRNGCRERKALRSSCHEKRGKDNDNQESTESASASAPARGSM
eukprot:scaffold1850_cov194-Pinguiococcus_pyrenoidosus.AAC.6